MLSEIKINLFINNMREFELVLETSKVDSQVDLFPHSENGQEPRHSSAWRPHA